MAEKITMNKEFEQKPNREVERKFLPLFPENLQLFREYTEPIEQLYLSHPSEQYSLRLRQTSKNGELVYHATLKDTGRVTAEGLDRLEIETEISQETYEYYRSPELPVIRKLRAETAQGVVIDWFEDGHIQAEAEGKYGWESFVGRYNLTNQFIEVTGDSQANNEWRAHYQHRLQNEGREALVPKPPLNIEAICESLRYRNGQPTVVRIMGRSGSGKSTIVTELQNRLLQDGTESVVLSTDDYNKGKRFLDAHKGEPWDNWDDPFVYDTAQAAADIDRLLAGEFVARTRFDFSAQEPVIDGVIEAAPVIIVEGIYSKAPEIVRKAHLAYTVPTSLATSIGRRLARDFSGERINESLPTPHATLRHILEKAEPAYRAQ